MPHCREASLVGSRGNAKYRPLVILEVQNLLVMHVYSNSIALSLSDESAVSHFAIVICLVQ